MQARNRVKKMEKILNRQLYLTDQLTTLLTEVEDSQDDFNALLTYYQSQTYMEDLSLEEKGHFNDLPRGILSEDGIYNLLFDRRELADKLYKVADELEL